MIKMSIKKGDTVLVIAGREKGKRGVIERVIPTADRVVISGVNLRKRHFKPSKKHPRGGIVEISGALHRSNVMIIDPATEKPVRASKIERETVNTKSTKK